MKITKLTLILLIISIAKLPAQEFKLGKVSIAELEEKVHPLDQDAVAAVLYKKGNARIHYDPNDGFIVITDVETRIKIYNKEGYTWANQNVWYYKTANLVEKVNFDDAVTYNLVDGKIEKTKLKSEGIFDETLNKFRSQKKITMPNVKEGSIIEFKYTIRTPNFRIIRDWDFQSSIPVNYSEFNTQIPEYYVFNSRQKGYVVLTTTTEKNNQSVVLQSKERSSSGGFGTVKTTFSSDKINYIETKTSFKAQNVPAMKEEAYVNNIDNYLTSVQHELSMVKFPYEAAKMYSTDWNSVVKTIYEYDDFGPELNKTGYFETELKEVLNGKNDDNEKILAILNYVKSNIKWNGYMGYSCDNGVRKTFKEKSGNTADINLMLTAMLRYAGFAANPVLVSTRSNGIAFFPNRTAFNYVIAAVETPQGNILLDASDKFSVPNVLPLRVLNWNGRLIRKDGSSAEVNLMPKVLSNDIIYLNYTIDAEGKITGKSRRHYSDYNALITRGKMDGVKEDDYLEKLENKLSKIEISDYKRVDEKEILKPIVESYSFTGTNLCDKIGDKFYINPMLFYTDDKNPFKQESREYPVDFGFPFQDKYNITIQIPPGFLVETLPEPLILTMQDNIGSFKFNSVVNRDLLQIIITHQINEAIVNTQQYEMLKEYYKAMIAKETEKIVLKRI